MNLKHLLGIEGLSREELLTLLQNAEGFVEISEREIKKVPTLRGKSVINLFLEPSTRTRTSFEIAGKRLSADTINIGGDSSVKKGETLIDTVQTIMAMAPDVLVIRHAASGAPHFLARHLSGTAIVNAGDGQHEHPTQALLDCLTLKQHFNAEGRDLSGITVAIVGDVLHSRVARSNIWAHKLLGNRIRLIGPPTLLPDNFAEPFGGGIEIHRDIREGIEGTDVVLCLRMQLERMEKNFVPSLLEYSREFSVTENLLSKYAPQSVVLHPGPINRGTEVSGEVAYGPRSLVNKQVANGVAVRMAVLYLLGAGSAALNKPESDDAEGAE